MSNHIKKHKIELTGQEIQLWKHYYYLYPEYAKELRDNNYDIYIQTSTHYNALALAKRSAINLLKEYDEQIQILDGTWACPICNLHIKDMGTHIEKYHNLNWEEFRLKYSWPNVRIYFSDTYRNNLKNNKLNFYNNTEAGINLRKLQSIKVSGNNNPACKEYVRLKISRSRKGSIQPLKTKQAISNSYNNIDHTLASSYGYKFKVLHGNKEIIFRSKTEYIIYLMLSYYDIKFDYEPYTVEYYNDDLNIYSHYLVDFVCNDILYEVKPKIYYFDKDKKYKYIINQLDKLNKVLYCLTPNNFYDLFSIPENQQKPLSYFENCIINNIINGDCVIIIPNKLNFNPYSGVFLSKLGSSEEEIKSNILLGELFYENKKCNRDK